jgi:hypothetical protein
MWATLLYWIGCVGLSVAAAIGFSVLLAYGFMLAGRDE